jgi:RNA polymerase sigma factor (sigma-70 family)
VEGLETRLRSLMIAGLAGDAAAYRVLLGELRTRLDAYFRRRLGERQSADADDLVQETLMAVHAKRATYDPARPFTAWMHAIARYKLVDHLRQNRLRPTVPIDDADALFADEAAEPTAGMDVDRLLSTLPQSSQTLIRRVKLEGHSIADAASETGLSETAAKVRIHRGVRTLARRIQGKAEP